MNVVAGLEQTVAQNELTFYLNGEVHLDDLANVARVFKDLLRDLQRDVGKAHCLEWLVVDLDVGSSAVTVAPIVHDEQDQLDATEVKGAYLKTGRSLRQRETVGYAHAQNTAMRVLRLMDDRKPSIRFATDEDEVTILPFPALERSPEELVLSKQALGAVCGRVQSVTNRRRLMFKLYDLADDHAITCYMAQGQEETMRNIWGKVVMVEGLIKRDTETGQALSVRQIRSVEPLPDEENPDAWRDAIGAAKGYLGTTKSEDLIRGSRDDDG